MGDSPDLIDFTALQKRGLIKKKEIKKTAAPISKDGFIDFSAMGEDKINKIIEQKQTNHLSQLTNSMPSLIPLVQSTSVQSPQQTQSTPSTFTSFWDDVPGQPQTQTQSTPSTPSYYNGSSSISGTSSYDGIDHLKVKLEDMEYKLSILTEKLETITSKLINFEQKVS